MRKRSLLLALLCASGAWAQEVKVGAFGANGQLSWTASPDTDYTVEWSSSLAPTATWSRTWSGLRGLSSTGGVETARVPMFYRLSCWTNGLFVRMPAGRTLVYSVSNALHQVWTQEISVVGSMWIPRMSNDYMVVSVKDIYEGDTPAGGGSFEMNIARSTDTALYGLNPFASQEAIEWQSGPVGMAWTNTAFGELRRSSIEAVEAVQVPAGTIPGCIKFRKTDLGSMHPNPNWYEWVCPGFMVVKWVDYYTDPAEAAPVVYELVGVKAD